MYFGTSTEKREAKIGVYINISNLNQISASISSNILKIPSPKVSHKVVMSTVISHDFEIGVIYICLKQLCYREKFQDLDLEDKDVNSNSELYYLWVVVEG